MGGEQIADLLVRDSVAATLSGELLCADMDYITAYFNAPERHGNTANYRQYYMEDNILASAVDRVYAALFRASREIDVFAPEPPVLDLVRRPVRIFHDVLIHIFPELPITWHIQEYTTRYMNFEL